MSTKERALELLERSREKHLSGEEIARTLGVSRSAVWKAIKQLKEEGHAIAAVTNRGYILESESGVLSLQGVLPYLDDTAAADRLHFYDCLESTNKTAKELALTGAPHGSAVIADRQTAGRGRFGRSFYSPAGSGLYISFVLRPAQLPLSDPTRVTSAAAVALCRAIRAETGLEPEIKWVNDILLGGKKICGILTEAVTDVESGAIDWLVLGMGLNITTASFPKEIAGLAASLEPGGGDGTLRSRIAARLITAFSVSPDWMSSESVFAEYKARLTMLGKPVRVHSPRGDYEATALDLDESYRLIVRRSGGELESLSSGEVSVRPQN